MEIVKEVERLIREGKILDAFELVKQSAPEELRERIEKSFRDAEEIKKLDGIWKKLMLILHFVYASQDAVERQDKQSLVSCVVSSVNAIKLTIELGMKSITPVLMRNAARALILMDMKENAERMYTEAEKICEENRDEEMLAAIENDLATLYYDMGKYNEAKVKAEEALEIRRKIGTKEELAESLATASEIYVKLGDFDEAEECYREAEKLYRELVEEAESFKLNLAILLSNYAMFRKKLGRYQEAEKMFKEALEIFQNLERIDADFMQFVAAAYRHLGDLYREMKEYSKAEEYYKLSREKFRDIQKRWESVAS
ncbi:tetratricopeptide repeat protein [Archaeoglobus fulgidus]|uniref:TPR domain-containing protein n=1 Tax=Archaeoglobus fulgidus (strain ATCC 49558 / DSM 4304 / JCM 9628 / NBRC 100126 / VC-16) TaxID=224325 RepID=O28309_ARCFU|nr:tetratricopeptide repeat protein [Archaeoglobus fulgidus]AAB89285.1 TPR domain-containing protein [Archaeoglobus fulgidus DSM 4304]